MSQDARGLLGLAVAVEGQPVGRVVDVALDRGLRRVLGLDVRDADGVARFLPAPAALLDRDPIAIPTALALLDRAASGFYDECGVRLGELTRLAWSGADVPADARLFDVEISAEGMVGHLLLGTGAWHLRLDRRSVRVRLDPGEDGFRPVGVHVAPASAGRGRRRGAGGQVSPALPGVPRA
ncbi:MAG: hypothetical protein R3C15_19840 [Thermoleophilia bacterium]